MRSIKRPETSMNRTNSRERRSRETHTSKEETMRIDKLNTKIKWLEKRNMVR